MKYRLVTKPLNTIQPGEDVLETSASLKNITLRDRGSGEAEAVYLEPVRDMRYYALQIGGPIAFWGIVLAVAAIFAFCFAAFGAI